MIACFKKLNLSEKTTINQTVSGVIMVLTCNSKFIIAGWG